MPLGLLSHLRLYLFVGGRPHWNQDNTDKRFYGAAGYSYERNIIMAPPG